MSLEQGVAGKRRSEGVNRLSKMAATVLPRKVSKHARIQIHPISTHLAEAACARPERLAAGHAPPASTVARLGRGGAGPVRDV